jgi:hypothetical protein
MMTATATEATRVEGRLMDLWGEALRTVLDLTSYTPGTPGHDEAADAASAALLAYTGERFSDRCRRAIPREHLEDMDAFLTARIHHVYECRQAAHAACDAREVARV